MKSEKEIIVIGHKNPDTDSICSAISYAWVKNQITGKNYSPKRAGDINKETAFALNYFKTDAPEYISDVRSQVKDIELKIVPSVKKNISIKQAYSIMKEYDSTTLCITNNEEEVSGLITMTDIASSDMDVYDNRIVSNAKTPYENIVNALEAKVLCGDISGKFENGRVTIGANTPEMMIDYISKGDMVILGDRFESQFFSIEMGVSCIVLCTGSEPREQILDMAKKHSCIVLSSPYDTYTVARLINQSMPIGYFMTNKNLMTFEESDFTDEVKEVMSKVRHRYFPIINENGKYQGFISKRSFIAMEKKQVIMVDHNEKIQAVDGIETSDILEIIDHHRLGGMQSINPVLFRNQPLGCTGTIIYQIAEENGIKLPKQIAGLLCSAILSDTLMFRSPTCTEIDKKIALILAEIAEINVEDYAQAMFEAGSDLSSRSTEEIFYQDYKTFSSNGVSFGVGQVTSVSRVGLEQMQPKLLEYMKAKYRQNPEIMLFFMLTNIIEESTIVLCCGGKSQELSRIAFGRDDENGIKIEGMVSRKKQFVPALMSALQEL